MRNWLRWPQHSNQMTRKYSSNSSSVARTRDLQVQPVVAVPSILHKQMTNLLRLAPASWHQSQTCWPVLHTFADGESCPTACTPCHSRRSFLWSLFCAAFLSPLLPPIVHGMDLALASPTLQAPQQQSSPFPSARRSPARTSPRPWRAALRRRRAWLLWPCSCIRRHRPTGMK